MKCSRVYKTNTLKVTYSMCTVFRMSMSEPHTNSIICGQQPVISTYSLHLNNYPTMIVIFSYQPGCSKGG